MVFPRQEYWVGCHFLLQGIFPTQGSNPGLLYCRQILYWLSYKGSPFSENHMKIHGRDFFHLTYVEPKYQSDEHNQTCANDCQCLIWILWYRLSPVECNTGCYQLTSQFDHHRFQLVYPTSEHHPARNLSMKSLLILGSVTAPSPYTAHIFFCFWQRTFKLPHKCTHLTC